MLKYPNFDGVALKIGPLAVHWYGIMYLVAFAVAWYLARRRARQPGSTWDATSVDDLIFFGMLGTIIGGRVGYVLVYGHKAWAADPWYPLKIWEGGMSFHGGLIGVMLAFAWFAISRKRKVGDVFDFAAPLPGLGLFAGRLGNFINGELWGGPTTLPWGMEVTNKVTGTVQVLHPSQLYEATLEGLVMFALLWWFTSRPRVRYAPTALFLVWYALSRIAVEFVRVPDEQMGYLAGTHWLTTGMVLSVPLLLAGLVLAVVAGLVLAVVAVRRHERSGNYQAAA